MSLPKTNFPFPLLYATIEFDHAGMVQGYNDPEADEGARGIVGKKYLVWLHMMVDLFVGRNDPCSYLVGIVAQSPRRVDASRGMTAKMFVPIAPNADPDGERPSVHPTGPFDEPTPFPRGDCAHWTNGEVVVALMSVPEGLDNASAYQLPCKGMSLVREITDDDVKVAEARAEKAARRSRPLHPPPDNGGSSSQGSDARSPQGREDGAIGTDGAPTMDTVDDSLDPSIPDASVPEPEDDPFLNPFVPLATISLDISWISEVDSLPNIYDFFQERDQIQRIVERVRSRERS